LLTLACNVVGCKSGALAESDNAVEWPFGCNVLVELVECISIALSRILFEVFEELIIRRKCVSDLFYKLAELLPSISKIRLTSSHFSWDCAFGPVVSMIISKIVS